MGFPIWNGLSCISFHTVCRIKVKKKIVQTALYFITSNFQHQYLKKVRWWAEIKCSFVSARNEGIVYLQVSNQLHIPIISYPGKEPSVKNDKHITTNHKQFY
jgi:hypothetical protein